MFSMVVMMKGNMDVLKVFPSGCYVSFLFWLWKRRLNRKCVVYQSGWDCVVQTIPDDVFCLIHTFPKDVFVIFGLIFFYFLWVKNSVKKYESQGFMLKWTYPGESVSDEFIIFLIMAFRFKCQLRKKTFWSSQTSRMDYSAALLKLLSLLSAI